MTSASPRRWRVSCGEPDSVPHGRRGGGGPRAHRSPPALGRIDCLPDRNGVRRGLPAARRGRGGAAAPEGAAARSEEHTSELQSQSNLVCRLLLEKKKSTVM